MRGKSKTQHDTCFLMLSTQVLRSCLLSMPLSGEPGSVLSDSLARGGERMRLPKMQWRLELCFAWQGAESLHCEQRH